jgi:hypothetical protein
MQENQFQAVLQAAPTRQSEVGKLTTSESQRARDCQQVSTVADTPGSSRSDPAGMMISRPLRVAGHMRLMRTRCRLPCGIANNGTSQI